MRQLFQLQRGDEARVIQAYAEAEQCAEGPRESDLHSLTLHENAARLLADGIRKGWIHETSQRPENLLDESGGSAFLNLNGATKVE